MSDPVGALGHPGAADALRDRDHFHMMLNLDSFDGSLSTARTLADGFLTAARRRLDGGGLEAELRAFRYTPQALRDRMDAVYQGMADDVDRYEAKHSWTLRTRENVVEWLRQMAPFNQTDGSWLRRIAPVGPMDPVSALLFRIYVEELGSGDPSLNHANVYTELLRTVGIELPDIRTRAYADNPDLLDSAFTLPLFQLVVSEFPQDFRPELLGMTLYLEWSSLELKNMVRLHEFFGLDPHFYELHVAIDNAATGHGAMAMHAIELHLEDVRIQSGDDAVQEQWERIWVGYVAFATTGTLAQDMAAHSRRRPAPADKVAEMIRGRAGRGRVNHGQKRLTGVPIKDLFGDPARFMTALVEGGLAVPGDPDNSPFFDLLGSDGPMFSIFNAVEKEVWRDWVRGLPVAAAPSQEPTSGTGARMIALVDALRERQAGTPAHDAQQLTGPDPVDPGRHSVTWWFAQPTVALLRALSSVDNGWITPGKAEASTFVTDLLRGDNAMARAFATAPLPGVAATGKEIAGAWINDGCPLPVELDPARPLTLLSPPGRVAAHPTGAIHGTGSVH